MPACLRKPRSSARLAATWLSTPKSGAAKAYRSVPDDDAEADDWEAIDPDPAELEEWDEPLEDESFEDGPDNDDDDWDEPDDWRDFDQHDGDDED